MLSTLQFFSCRHNFCCKQQHGEAIVLERRSVGSSDFRSADFVRELILARDGALDVNSVLTRDEVQEIID
jgi:hypothetical protein